MSFNYNELFAPVPPKELVEDIYSEEEDLQMQYYMYYTIEEEEFRRRVEEIAEEMERY